MGKFMSWNVCSCLTRRDTWTAELVAAVSRGRSSMDCRNFSSTSKGLERCKYNSFLPVQRIYHLQHKIFVKFPDASHVHQLRTTTWSTRTSMDGTMFCSTVRW